MWCCFLGQIVSHPGPVLGLFLFLLLVHQVHHEGRKLISVVGDCTLICFFVVIEHIFKCVNVELLDKLVISVFDFVHEVERLHELIVLDVLHQLFEVDLLHVFLVFVTNFLDLPHQMSVLRISVLSEDVDIFIRIFHLIFVLSLMHPHVLLYLGRVHFGCRLENAIVDTGRRVSDGC